MWKRELIRNKIYAVLMVLASLHRLIILERDGTVLLLSLFLRSSDVLRKRKLDHGRTSFFMKVKQAGEGVFGAVMSAAEKKAMDMEIQRQLAEYDRKHIREIDALVLWELREQLGFGNKRLKKFYDNFSRGIEALIRRYEMEQGDDVWLCTYKLKEIGCDLEKWEKDRGDQ